jgi:hypothetical protein
MRAPRRLLRDRLHAPHGCQTSSFATRGPTSSRCMVRLRLLGPIGEKGSCAGERRTSANAPGRTCRPRASQRDARLRPGESQGSLPQLNRSGRLAALRWETSPADIAFRLAREVGEPVDEDVVWLALEDLGRLQLLEAPVVRQTAGLSRRDVIRKGALVASALAVPTVFSLVVPTASASICQEECSPGVTCVGTCTICNPAGLCEF